MIKHSFVGNGTPLNHLVTLVPSVRRLSADDTAALNRPDVGNAEAEKRQ